MLHNETPQGEPTAETPKIIEISPDAMYRIPGDDEPIDGNSLRNQRLMQKDYTKKTQSLSEREKSYQQQLAQRDEQIEKLKNQLTGLQLDDTYQSQQRNTYETPGRQPVNPVVTNGNDDVNNYDWLYNDANVPPTTQPQQGINSTPMNNLSLSQLAKMLSQHPDFQQPYMEKMAQEIQKISAAKDEETRRRQEAFERDLEIENAYKKQFGQKGVDLVYAMKNAEATGDFQRWYELQIERDKLVAQKAIADNDAAREAAQKEAVEQALSGPVRIEPLPNESKRDRERRMKKEAVERMKAIGFRRA